MDTVEVCRSKLWEDRKMTTSQVNTSTTTNVKLKRLRDASAFDAILVGEVSEAAAYLSSKQIAQRSKQISAGISNMSEEELDRLEVFSRSYLSRDRVRDVMKDSLANKEIDDELVMIVATLAKEFLSELCDGAVDVMKEQNLPTPGILPQHISDAHRRMRRNGRLKGHVESHPFAINGVTAFEPDGVVLCEDVPHDNEVMTNSAEDTLS